MKTKGGRVGLDRKKSNVSDSNNSQHPIFSRIVNAKWNSVSTDNFQTFSEEINLGKNIRTEPNDIEGIP